MRRNRVGGGTNRRLTEGFADGSWRWESGNQDEEDQEERSP